jgi:hypothetical protein
MDGHHRSRHALLGSFLSSLSRTRRLEDRIRQLCTDAVICVEPAELDWIMDRLKTALHDHALRVRRMAAAGPAQPDRRKPALDSQR